MANNNPWLALSTYEEEDKDKFKGREKDTENVLTMLQQNECVVCYAASGDGKSSLINAGVCPGMRKVGMFPVKISFTTSEYEGFEIPHKDDGSIDFDNLILKKIEEGISLYQNDFIKKFDIKEDFHINFEKISKYEGITTHKSLWWKLRTETIQIPFGEFDNIPVLIFDQFEEIFRATWKVEFFEWLEKFMKDVCPDEFTDNSDTVPCRKLFKLIFSLRYEYVGELDYWCSQKAFIPQMMLNRFFLKPLSKEQAISVIREQENFDTTIGKMRENADLIVNNIVAKTSNSRNDIEEISAIVLSLVCYVLYDKWNENFEYSLDDIDLDDIIYDFYLDKLHKIGMSDNSREVMEDVLISSVDTRLRMPISDNRLQQVGINKFLFTEGDAPSLKSEHLIKIERFNGEYYIEFIHDRLSDSISVKRKIEREEKRNACKYRSNLKIGLYSSACLFLLLFIFLTYRTLNVGNFSEYASLYVKSKDIKEKAIEVTRNNFSNRELDYTNATSLIYVSEQDRYTDVYENVLYYEEKGSSRPYIYYAHNAKKIIFAHHTGLDSLFFGENTEDVLLFNPQGIKTIHCANPYTRISVLYGYLNQCILWGDLQNIHFQELGLFSTFVEKVKYRLHRLHGLVFILLLFVLMFSYYDLHEYTGYKRFVFLFLPLFLFVLLLIVNFELEWLGIIELSDRTVIWSTTLLTLLLNWWISSLFRTKSHSFKDKRVRYSFVYCSEEGRKDVVQLRQALIDTRMEGDDDDFDLNLSIVRYGDFRPDAITSTLSESNVAIVLFDMNDFHDFDRIKRFVSVISNGPHIMVPIIVGCENVDNLNMPDEILPFFQRRDFVYIGSRNQIRAKSREVIYIHEKLKSTTNIAGCWKLFLFIVLSLVLSYFFMKIVLLIKQDY